MIQWIADNWTIIAEVAVLLYGLAKIITNLTPSDKDNQILVQVVAFVEKIVDLFVPNLKKDGGTHNANWLNLFKKK